MLTLTLRQRLAALPLSLVLALMTVGGIAGGSLYAASRAATEIIEIGEALSNHQQGDMMHDALRADVLVALLNGPSASNEARAELRRDMGEHIESFRSTLRANREAALPPAIRNAVADVAPALDAYIKAAQRMVELAESDLEKAKAEFPSFIKLFEELETRNEGVSTLIRAENRVRADNAAKMGEDTLALLGGVTLVVLLGAVFLTRSIGRSISRPLDAASQAIEAIGVGRRDVALSYPVDDTIGRVIGAVMTLQQQASDLDAARARSRANHESTTRKVAALENATGAFTHHVGAIVQTLAATGQQLHATSDAMSRSAAHAIAEIQELRGRADQTADTVRGAASAAGQLGDSIGEVGRHTGEAARNSAEAAGRVEEATQRIQELSQASQRIGDVVGLISSIAGQTNLLALNATIEAARAGEAGKGFAVVASEVKSLANQTTRATDDIQAQIAGIQDIVQRTVQAMSSVSSTVESVRAIGGVVEGAVNRQTDDTQTIVRAMAEGVSAVTDMVSHLGEVQGTVAQADRTASDLAAVAGQLNTQMTALRGEVERYVTLVRAE